MKMFETKGVELYRTLCNPFILIVNMRNAKFGKGIIQSIQNFLQLNHLDYLTLTMQDPRFFEMSITI